MAEVDKFVEMAKTAKAVATVADEKVVKVVDVPPDKVAQIHSPVIQTASKISVVFNFFKPLFTISAWFRVAGISGIVASALLFWQSSMIQGIFHDYVNSMMESYNHPSITYKAHMRRIEAARVESTRIAADSE